MSILFKNSDLMILTFGILRTVTAHTNLYLVLYKEIVFTLVNVLMNVVIMQLHLFLVLFHLFSRVSVT